jgi:hypothetical protein
LTERLLLATNERAPSIISLLDDRLKLMSIVVAGFSRNYSTMANAAHGGGLASGSEKSAAWREQCRTHGQSQSNPYIRAIFSYIASGDWRDVLDEQSLCLADRIGVALRFLSDDEVNII